MDPNAMVSAITALAIFLAEGKTPEDIELLRSIFSQLDHTLSTIAIQREMSRKRTIAQQFAFQEENALLSEE